MTPEALDQIITDFNATAVLCRMAALAMAAGKPSSAYDFARAARNLLSALIAEVPPSMPPVDNSPPLGG